MMACAETQKNLTPEAIILGHSLIKANMNKLYLLKEILDLSKIKN